MDKKNKLILGITILIVGILAILIAIIIYSLNNNISNNETNDNIAEVILDDCTDEYENIEEEIVPTNTEQLKVSPNCKIILIKHYKGCNHEINEYIKVPERLVNLTKEELQNEYKNWDIKEFTNDNITLYKEFEGICGEHYILKDEDGKIVIYKTLENGKEEMYERTDISIDYLPIKDKESIQNGLEINGKEKLNQVIESFE